jgi:integrase/recombinase XerD
MVHALRLEDRCQLDVKGAQQAHKGVPYLGVSGKGGKTRYVPQRPGAQVPIDRYRARG